MTSPPPRPRWTEEQEVVTLVPAPRAFLDGCVLLHQGDCLQVLASLPEASVDAIVTDPPYHLSFMGRAWDGGDIAFRPETWVEALRVLKPGGYLAAFGAPKQVHRLAVAIEDAGFEMRDRFLSLVASDVAVTRFLASLSEAQADAFWRCIDDCGFGGELAWIFGGGFPKSHNLHGDWEGRGTALKPAYETIVLARKPLDGTVAETVMRHGTGALNIDGCRIHADDAQGGAYTVKRLKPGATLNATGGSWRPEEGGVVYHGETKPGRWPANVLHDGSAEVLAAFPEAAGQQRNVPADPARRKTQAVYGAMRNGRAGEASAAKRYGANGIGFEALPGQRRGDSGSAARFFYSAKADAADRLGSPHPTIKPVDLMQWLVRLVCPVGGLVLDPFAGTGTTGEAAWREGMKAVLIEREPDHCADIAHRMELARSSLRERRRSHLDRRGRTASTDGLPLFGSIGQQGAGMDRKLETVPMAGQPASDEGV